MTDREHSPLLPSIHLSFLISSTMSTVTVSSLAFYKPKSIYDTLRNSDILQFRKNSISDDSIFGREKLNYVYDVPRNLNIANNPPKSDKSCLKVHSTKKSRPKISFLHDVSFEKPTNYKSNGLHLCQEAENIRR